MTTFQLRRYEIKPGEMDAFLGEDEVHRDVPALREDRLDAAHFAREAEGERARMRRGERAVEEAGAVAQAVAQRAEAHGRGEDRTGNQGCGALRDRKSHGPGDRRRVGTPFEEAQPQALPARQVRAGAQRVALGDVAAAAELVVEVEQPAQRERRQHQRERHRLLQARDQEVADLRQGQDRDVEIAVEPVVVVDARHRDEQVAQRERDRRFAPQHAQEVRQHVPQRRGARDGRLRGRRRWRRRPGGQAGVSTVKLSPRGE